MRKLLFKSLQKVQKGNFFKNIEFMERNYGKYSKEIQEKNFFNFLKHAINTTDYYADYGKYKTINECPVITKDIVKENYKDFLSNKYKKEELVKTTTSGSYGTPFTFLFTKKKKEIQRSDIIYFSRWANYDVGVKHGYALAKDKPMFLQILQNQYAIIPFKITDQWLEKEIQKIKRRKLKILIGYPSTIGALAKHLISKNETYKLEGVITISEVLIDSVREDIEKAFGVKPLSRYTTEEFGVLGMECPKQQNLHLNNVHFIIEVLDENNQPVQPGEQGEVVVTDLYSHAMPLIRYKTGDLAILGKDTCECGLNTPYLEKLLGRQLEVIYAPDGSKVESMAINGRMRDIEGVRQFQFIQTGKSEYTLNIVKLKEMIDEIEIAKRYKKILGEEANIIFNYVDDIPPLKSGKRPYILQRYYKE